MLGEDGLRSTGSGEGPAGHIAHIFAHSDSIMGSMMANLLLPSHRLVVHDLPCLEQSVVSEIHVKSNGGKVLHSVKKTLNLKVTEDRTRATASSLLHNLLPI